MKKTIFFACVFAAFQGLFGQKTWFLSLEASPTIKFERESFYSNSSGTSLGTRKANASFGLGGRLFRSSGRRLQPFFGMDFRGIRPLKTYKSREFFNDQTLRQFAISSDLGYRLESRALASGWRVSFGAGLLVWLPFLSQKENFEGQKRWTTFYEEPQMGFGFSLNFGKEMPSGRRVDYGLELQKFRQPYYYYESLGPFQLLKFRCGVSIERVEKGS